MQDISKQDNLVWIQMALSNLDFCYCAAGNVTAIQLQLCGYPFLRHTGFFPQLADVMANPFSTFWLISVTSLQKCTHMGAILLDIIICR